MITILILAEAALVIPTERSSYKQHQEKQRAERRESEEEEQRCRSVLMLEPKSRKNKTDQID